MSTFTWKSGQGAEFEVEAEFDVDQWAGREMRAAERLCGGALEGSGFYATTGLVLAVSIARTVPGYTIESADAELTFGRVREIIDQMRKRELEAVAVADPLVEEPGAGSGDDVVPTPPGPATGLVDSNP